MARYALKSYLGTILYFEMRTNRLTHAHSGTFLGRILVVDIDTLPAPRVSAWLPWADPYDPEPEIDSNFEVTILEGGKTVAIKRDGYLCPSPDGNVSNDRSSAQGWETFTLVDLNSVTLRSDAKTYPEITPRRIPNTIHNVFLGTGIERNILSEFIDSQKESFREKNGHYDHRFWTDEEIIESILSWYGHGVLSKYLLINPRYGAARADFFRYLLMYKLGGIYLDLKSNVSRNLDEIINPDDSFLLSLWGSEFSNFGNHDELIDLFGHGEFQQWFIVSEPGHQFLASVIDEVIRRIELYDRKTVGVGAFGVYKVTGPIAYTIAIKRVISAASYRTIKSADEGFLYHDIAHKKGQSLIFPSRRHYSQLTDDIVNN